MMTADAIAAELARFIHPDQFTELRALHVGQRGRTFSGWFSGRHLSEMARNALALSRQAAGVYFCPNPVEPSVAERRLNKVLDVHRGFALTHDVDVIERRFLIVDIDPIRHARFGEITDPHNCPSASREVVLARLTGYIWVEPCLAKVGFQPPMVMLSGNGIHLIFQTEPTPSKECGNADPHAGLLRYLRDQFNCPRVSIDTNTFNPSRMLKVPGTIVRKGEPSTSRPHRIARILEVPNGWLEPKQPPVIAVDKPTKPQPAPEPAERRTGDRPAPARVEPKAKRSGRKSRAPQRLFDPGSRTDGTPVH